MWFRSSRTGTEKRALGGKAVQRKGTQRKVRSRRLLPTTNTEEKAIAAPAIIGLSSPAAASGSAATL